MYCKELVESRRAGGVKRMAGVTSAGNVLSRRDRAFAGGRAGASRHVAIRPRGGPGRRAAVVRAPLFAALFLVLAGGAGAQPYPVKPVRLIVPFAPGGDTDTVARLIAPRLAEALGQQVIVDNRPGAGSLIGIEAMLRAPADGYTLAMGTISSLAVLPVTRSNVPYDPVQDIAPVILATVVPYVLHVHPSVPARSVAEFVRFAAARPGELAYGTPGVATGVHLTTEYFSSTAGVQLTHVPYKGSGPVLVDLLAGNIPVAFTTFSTSGQHVRSGRLRALAIAASARSRDFPQVPTMSEAGYRGFEASTWHGVVTRAGTPRAIVTRLNAGIARILNGADVRPALVSAGFDIGAGTVEDFEHYVKSEIGKWRKVAARAKVRAD
ncbi:MAG: tripartite tricarboxylate transporter substrate binding protein [Burkholderiales bacterium]|nr:tripartite tricarboxylate transporter substrate binding protein [Burkholderiales bacterium]